MERGQAEAPRCLVVAGCLPCCQLAQHAQYSNGIDGEPRLVPQPALLPGARSCTWQQCRQVCHPTASILPGHWPTASAAGFTVRHNACQLPTPIQIRQRRRQLVHSMAVHAVRCPVHGSNMHPPRGMAGIQWIQEGLVMAFALRLPSVPSGLTWHSLSSCAQAAGTLLLHGKSNLPA